MKWFKNLTIRSKLLLVFGVLCVLLVGLSALAYQTLAAIQQNERDNVDQIALMTRTGVEIRAHQNRIRGEMLLFLVTDNPNEKSTIRREIEDRSTKVHEGIGQVKDYWTARHDVTGLVLISEVEKELAGYREGREEQFKLVEAGKADKARLLGTGSQAERFESVRAVMLKIDRSYAVELVTL
ncbi:hypothetical protein CCP3SC5AM1_2100005 [Gammaproteobacteria bacterium]